MSQLDDVVIAAPCPISWDSMPGNERVRHCAQCSRNVYNISDMTTGEAEQFLKQNGSSQCVRLFRRADGKLMTDNCPAALRAIRNKCRFIAKVAAGVIASFVAFVPSVRAQPAPSEPKPNETSNVLTNSKTVLGRLKARPNLRPNLAQPKAPEGEGRAGEVSPSGAQNPDLNGIRPFSPLGWPFDGISNSSNDAPKKQVMLGSDDMCNPQPVEHRATVHMGKMAAPRPASASSTASSASSTSSGASSSVSTASTESAASSLPAEQSVEPQFHDEPIPRAHWTSLFGPQSIETIQTTGLENKSADWRAHHFFSRGQSFESEGKFVLAISSLQSALSACDSSPDTDPKFRSTIEEHLKNLRSRMSKE